MENPFPSRGRTDGIPMKYLKNVTTIYKHEHTLAILACQMDYTISANADRIRITY